MDSRTWQQPQTRGSVIAEKNTWLLVAAFALLLAGFMVNQSTTAFFTDTRVVSGNNFITASVALNETPFTAFNFEKFVPGDVFVRPVQVTNSTASNSGAINVNYYMTVKDNFSNCSTQDPKCTDAKGTLSDPVNGLRLVAIRCFSDINGTVNVACENSTLKSVRLVKGVMETIWPAGATNATTDIAGIVRDRNETAQYGNIGGTGSEAIATFPGLPNGGAPSDYFGRPIVFARAGALSTQPISVKINPRRNDTTNPAVLGAATLTNTSNPVVQGSDVLRLGGTVQDLDGNWFKKVDNYTVGSPNACGEQPLSTYLTSGSANGSGCGAEVVGVPIQTLSNPNCNGLATSAANRAVVNATGGQGSQTGPGANATVISVNQAAGAPQVFSSQSQGACFMGGSDFEKNAPIVLSPRINNQLMAAGAGETPRILSDIPAQSLFDAANTIAGLGAGKSDNLALIVYLPSWATQSTQDETGTTALTVQSRQTLDAQNNPVAVPIGGAGNKTGGKASYTVAFTAVQPVGQTFALANVAQQSVNTLQALAGQIQTNNTAFQAQSSDTATVGTNATLLTGGIQTLSPNNLPGGGTQVISVTGRGFAKVTAVPQNVKAEATSDLTASLGSSGATTTYRYRVTAATSDTLANSKVWTQGEPSSEVAVSVVGKGKVTITWNVVPGATHYHVFRDVTDSSGVYTARIVVDKAVADTNAAPNKLGFKSSASYGVIDDGTNAVASETSGKYPAVGRPCVAYASIATFGMCPKIEVMPAGDIDVTTGTAATGFTVKTGEIVGKSSATWSGLLAAPSTWTDATSNEFATTAATVGVQSANQVSFQVTTPLQTALTRYGIRITNPSADSLPLDVRGKVLTFKDSVTVIPQAVTSYTPPRIGRISTGNTLVIKGTGFQKGSIVHLGTLSDNNAIVAPDLAATASATFVSRSHIANRTDASVTQTTLGTAYATGYASEQNSTAGTLGADGLASKDLVVAAANTTIPYFSYDHKKVVVNSDSQITITGITITNVADAPIGVAAKIFNPDGSVVFGQTFGIAAPGIEQIVQIDSAGKQWLSAAQGQTVKLRFQAAAAGTFNGTPKVAITCWADGATVASPTAPGTSQDPCFNSATGATNVGVTQIGDLQVVARSGLGDAVEGTFAIAPDAKVNLRKFTMTNGDAAVFSNFFSISQAPTFKQVSYTSGTNRIVGDDISASLISGDTTKGFNVVGRIPRGSTRRVLITGSGFVRGSYGPMSEPIGGGTAAVAGTAGTAESVCGGCFGKRSTSSLVSADALVTTTPKIEFSNAGVSVNAALTTVVMDAGVSLDMRSTNAQSTDDEASYIATKRLTAVVTVADGATAGPVTMTITNPDGGKIVVPSAFIVDGVPTIDVTRDAVIAPVTSGGTIISASTASIKQGEVKATTNAIFVYGSGFFGTPQVSISGTGVRVTSVRLSKADPGSNTSVDATDDGLKDSVLRIELAAESTAPTGARDITIVLPDGQSVTKTGVFTVNAP